MGSDVARGGRCSPPSKRCIAVLTRRAESDGGHMRRSLCGYAWSASSTADFGSVRRCWTANGLIPGASRDLSAIPVRTRRGGHGRQVRGGDRVGHLAGLIVSRALVGAGIRSSDQGNHRPEAVLLSPATDQAARADESVSLPVDPYPFADVQLLVEALGGFTLQVDAAV